MESENSFLSNGTFREIKHLTTNCNIDDLTFLVDPINDIKKLAENGCNVQPVFDIMVCL